MELEELKTAWTSLNQRLERQELLKSAILRETLKSKSDTSLSRMINYGYFSLVTQVLGLFFMIWIAFLPHIDSLTLEIVYYAVMFGVVCALISQIISLKKLQKIDFSLPISENLNYVREYKTIYINILKVVLSYSGFLLLIVIGYVAFFMKTEPWRLIVIFGALSLGAVWGCWEYKRMYQKNIEALQKSLEELRELGED
ncbi:MAG: hypothetical protein LBS52_09665 [Dysgonamonadaceae bacterium]|jgi:hypothetical protein|nr:hypothetical protein [Dysgonamonadaceae bacterium]